MLCTSNRPSRCWSSRPRLLPQISSYPIPQEADLASIRPAGDQICTNSLHIETFSWGAISCSRKILPSKCKPKQTNILIQIGVHRYAISELVYSLPSVVNMYAIHVFLTTHCYSNRTELTSWDV